MGRLKVLLIVVFIGLGASVFAAGDEAGSTSSLALSEAKNEKGCKASRLCSGRCLSGFFMPVLCRIMRTG